MKTLFVWTLIITLQILEIFSECRNYGEIFRCSFEKVRQPMLYPIRAKNRHYFGKEAFTELTFTNSFIPMLRKHSFNLETPRVTGLAITDSQLEEIRLDALTNFTDLSKLNLDYNNLKKIQPVFQQQYILGELTLSHNNISWIDLEAFKTQKTKLKFLDLSFNRLSSLGSQSNSTNLEEVNVSQKSVFGILEGLEKLDLSNNKLEVLNRWAFSNNTNLKYLNLSKNAITEVKLRAFDKLSNLIYLNLSRNLISKLDFGFSIGLGSLQTLDLSFNRLSVLDSNVVFNTPMLENLQLHHNFLRNVSVLKLKESTKLNLISIHTNKIDCSLLLKLLKELKAGNVTVVEGSGTEGYSFHGISCNMSSTTGSETTSENSHKQPSETFPNKDLLDDFENVFINSKFYEIFREFVKNENENINIVKEINAKLSVRDETERNLLKEIILKQNAILNVLGNITISETVEN